MRLAQPTLSPNTHAADAWWAINEKIQPTQNRLSRGGGEKAQISMTLQEPDNMSDNEHDVWYVTG